MRLSFASCEADGIYHEEPGGGLQEREWVSCKNVSHHRKLKYAAFLLTFQVFTITFNFKMLIHDELLS